MARVYLPLASSEAYGAFGETIVYQGVTCRVYVIPSDPRTDAQIAQREIFHDVTKMVRYFGLWARGAWRTVFGARWFTGLYRRITENGLQRLLEADAEFDAMTVEQKDAWNQYAPFQVTFNAPGMIFYAVMRTWELWCSELGAPFFGWSGIDPDNAVGAGEWALKDLSGVMSAGKHDDDQLLISYNGSWIAVVQALAYGGDYHESSTTGAPFVSFYFHGSQFALVYRTSTGGGIAKVSTFGMGDQLVDQNSVTTEYQVEKLMPGLSRSLHYVTITRQGTGAINLDALEISARKVKTPVQAALEVWQALPSVSLSRVTSMNLTKNIWVVVPWSLVNWDSVGMFDVQGDVTRVVCKGSGFYSISAQVKIQGIYPGSNFFELRCNGIVIIDDFRRARSDAQQDAQVLGGVRNFELIEGDFLDVRVKIETSNDRLLLANSSIDPLFEVSMLSRQRLYLANVNVTVN